MKDNTLLMNNEVLYGEREISFLKSPFGRHFTYRERDCDREVLDLERDWSADLIKKTE